MLVARRLTIVMLQMRWRLLTGGRRLCRPILSTPRVPVLPTKITLHLCGINPAAEWGEHPMPALPAEAKLIARNLLKFRF